MPVPRLRTAGIGRLLPLLLLLMLPAVAQARFDYAIHDGTITITRYIGHDDAVTIPDTINGLPVTGIGDNVFRNCLRLTSVTIPNSVTSIGNDAFCHSRLTSVTIPYSVTSIGERAFKDCTRLTGVYFQGDAPSIGGSSVFRDDNHATVYYLPWTTGWDRTFANRPAAVWYSPEPYTYTVQDETITITGYTGPGGDVAIPSAIYGLPVTSIGDNAFHGCTNLSSVTIPSGITSIGEAAFYWCTSMISITIPNSVTSIGFHAFENCTSLSNITIPNSVTNIAGWAFADCSSLSSISIPNNVTSINVSTFADCTSLNSVTIPNSVTSIGPGAFYDCTSLEDIMIPNSVSRIGSVAFYLSGLYYISIPNSVTNIEDFAFGYCYNLGNVTIGNSITDIEDYAFYSCGNLEGVYFQGDAPGIGGPNVFYYDNNATIYYVAGTTGWGPTFAGLPTALWTP